MIAGLMRVKDFPYISLTVESLASFVDQMFFLVDRNHDTNVLDTIANHPKTAKICISTEPFKQPTSLNRIFELVKDVKPEIVFYPDEDDLLPNNRQEILDTLRSFSEPRAMMFYMLNCYGNIDTVSIDAIDKPHAKALIWTPEVSFLSLKGGYRGACRPIGYKTTFSKYPLRHLCRMDDACQQRRLKHLRIMNKNRKGYTPDWRPKRTVRFDPSWTTKQWFKVVRNLCGQ